MKDQELIQWLLEAQTPSIRYLTMRNLLGKPEIDSEVQAARGQMKTEGPIPEILAEQTEFGSWAGEHSYYTPKYTSTHWSMILLAELSADQTNEGLQNGADFMLSKTQEELSRRVINEEYGFSCLWGNLLRYVLHCGLDKDSRLDPVVQSLVFDALQGEWRCKYNDDYPCAWGAARTLWGFAGLPAELRSQTVNAAIHSGITFLLEAHSLLDADYPTPDGGGIHSLWFRLNYPLFYQADILFVLRVIRELGVIEHPGASSALEWLENRRQANGHWRGASPFRRRTWKALGKRGESDRWVSLQAALVLDQ